MATNNWQACLGSQKQTLYKPLIHSLHSSHSFAPLSNDLMSAGEWRQLLSCVMTDRAAGFLHEENGGVGGGVLDVVKTSHPHLGPFTAGRPGWSDGGGGCSLRHHPGGNTWQPEKKQDAEPQIVKWGTAVCPWTLKCFVISQETHFCVWLGAVMVIRKCNYYGRKQARGKGSCFIMGYG